MSFPYGDPSRYKLPPSNQPTRSTRRKSGAPKAKPKKVEKRPLFRKVERTDFDFDDIEEFDDPPKPVADDIEDIEDFDDSPRPVKSRVVDEIEEFDDPPKPVVGVIDDEIEDFDEPLPKLKRRLSPDRRTLSLKDTGDRSGAKRVRLVDPRQVTSTVGSGGFGQAGSLSTTRQVPRIVSPSKKSIVIVDSDEEDPPKPLFSGLVIPESPPLTRRSSLVRGDDDLFGAPKPTITTSLRVKDRRTITTIPRPITTINLVDDDEPPAKAKLPATKTLNLVDDDEPRRPESGMLLDDEDDLGLLLSPGVRPSPILPVGYQKLRDLEPFRDLADLIGFVNDNEDLTAHLLSNPDDPLAQYWLAQARRVVPGDVAVLANQVENSPLVWRVIGTALNVSARDPDGVLAELCWLGARNPAVSRQVDKLATHLKRWNLDATFRQKLATLRRGQRIPDGVAVELASMKYGKWSTTRDSAQGWLQKSLTTRQEELLAKHKSHAAWLKELGEDPDLAYDRSLDRLADVITSFNGNRVCVAVIHNGREIGITANRPDDLMGADLESLLHASRAVGAEGERRIKAVLADLSSGRGGRQRLTKRSVARLEVRMRKAIAFLRTLEAEHGRIRVVPYNGPLPLAGNGKEQEVHAEMVALIIGLQNPGAKLGVGKLCCLKCWVMLQDVHPGVFNRLLATHMNTYPWPPSKLLEDGPTLERLYGSGAAPSTVREALSDRSRWPALASAFFGAQGLKGSDDTGYASSQEPSTPVPSSPVFPVLELDREPDLDDENYQNYLDEGVALTEQEQRASQDPTPNRRPDPRDEDGPPRKETPVSSLKSSPRSLVQSSPKSPPRSLVQSGFKPLSTLTKPPVKAPVKPAAKTPETTPDHRPLSTPAPTLGSSKKPTKKLRNRKTKQ
ncbi:hypothetical protein Acor_34470 [Acrocarpospora corrugata]|uniref:Uncharacterized protein n=1 Tax=Acrocarpospora corrugata TaxID=35763 RepID=A0A5M3W249_9ACTN|nr:hypothetical protein [Acrocarpospora corrugata]GES01383.1 hypothetical protein Acor_34470 [Acrocarpospora corrugata]